jgi:hypothetical protein
MHAIVVSCITVGGVLFGHLYKRLNDLELELRGARVYNRRMWSWARRHIELYYQYRREDGPDPDPIPVEE